MGLRKGHQVASWKDFKELLLPSVKVGFNFSIFLYNNPRCHIKDKTEILQKCPTNK